MTNDITNSRPCVFFPDSFNKGYSCKLNNGFNINGWPQAR